MPTHSKMRGIFHSIVCMSTQKAVVLHSKIHARARPKFLREDKKCDKSHDRPFKLLCPFLPEIRNFSFRRVEQHSKNRATPRKIVRPIFDFVTSSCNPSTPWENGSFDLFRSRSNSKSKNIFLSIPYNLHFIPAVACNTMTLISDTFASTFSHCKLSSLPDTVYYIPNYLTKDEQEDLWNRVYSAPKPKWKVLKNRRLQNWGGLPDPKGESYFHVLSSFIV